ncbi:hypothetical protein SPBR_00485 [Sporothrix brasiliensis 5110]|uniref:Zn(2)-C6 fungal-type domain-containing protein n=1 Tax=Sporothrix brasiliensis 5110 TaxID=1398154 RepID=A0A0C2FHG9_9PEZI|nr:uncharacterized protein SPBR_00485 [Sporothrix brasiliensis 5110]KIH90528.1 hypothetical protein SPBR_00485 [Sporothrix brasiliensis 5110]
MDRPEKKTRESTSKVRTGCRTCKARRVKCDEAKPVCKRCAIGGRSCTYAPAEAASPARQNVIVVYVPPPSVHDGPTLSTNSAGIDFFHHHIAASLDGQVDPLVGSAFWGRLVLQLAHAEPCVRHAVAAASLVHQDVQLSLRHPAGYVAANRRAHAAWQRAAQSLAARIQRRSPDAHLVALVCSLLFTLIEFLRGRGAMAMLHVENGLQILAAHRQSRGEKGTSGGERVVPSSRRRSQRRGRSAVEDTILPIFARLNVLSSLAGKMTPPAYGTMDDYDDDDNDADASDLADVELRLVAILDTCIRFIGQASTKAAALAVDVADFAEQTRLQTTLDAWRRRFERLAGRTRRLGAAGLRHQFMVHVKAVGVWLRVCTSASETAVDAYLADFVELVDHATHVVKQLDDVGGPRALVSFDIQVLGPLYYAALKCRHPATRRRALALLRCAPRREGLWNAHVAYATAQRVIEREERQLDARGWPAEAARVHGLPLADDESRVRVVGPDLGHAGTHPDLDLDIVLSPAHPAALATEFRTKPWGLAGPWHVAREYIAP